MNPGGCNGCLIVLSSPRAPHPGVMQPTQLEGSWLDALFGGGVESRHAEENV